MAADRTTKSFGSRLREARERRGMTLRQIADATKISIAALEALERDDISRLPGGIFSRAFVRSYALEVGLNPDETIQDFIAQFPPDQVAAGRPRLVAVEDNEAIESDRRIASNVLRLAIVCVPVAIVIVYLSTAGTRSTQPIEQGPAAATAGSSNPSPAAAEPAVPATRGAAVAAIPTEQASRPDAAGERLVVGLSTAGRCWVTAIADGQRVIFREMLPGEQQVVEVKRDLRLTLGDAGAISTSFNGAPGRPLGKPGQVVTIQMNLTDFQRFVALP